MKNKYSFIAYVIMAILIFITAIALILAAGNIKTNKAALESKNKEILDYVNHSVELCEKAYDVSKADENERTFLNDYIDNINKYENVRTKANIAVAMLTDTADMLANKYSIGLITEKVSRETQHELAIVRSDIENAVYAE